jgi:Right handed beta helix region
MFRKWMHFLLILPLLVSALSQTHPAQAAGPALVDPSVVIWCPTSVTLPTSGRNGCTGAYHTFGELMTALSGKNPAVAGKLWIGKGYTGDENLVFDGSVLTSMAKYPLTIQGAWNGSGTNTVDLNTFSILDGDSLEIVGWQSSVTVRRILVQAVNTGGAAVDVITTGSIKLDRVQAARTTNTFGAYLENTSGSVTISNSAFYDGDYGLVIYSQGAVTLKSVTIDNNASIGARIYNDAGAPSPVTVMNSRFEANAGNGLTILSDGPVSLSNLSNKDNAEMGAYIDNRSGLGDVLLNGANSFLDNEDAGLQVFTNGKVRANTLIAYHNGLTTPNAPGVYIYALKAVTIGNAQFKSNSGHGLAVYTDGPITASNLNATNNNGNGLWLSTAAPATVQAVTLNQVNADFNHQAGLEIHADGKVLLKCSSAFNNDSYGLFVRGRINPSGPAALTLQGFLAYANTPNEATSPLVPVRTACP